MNLCSICKLLITNAIFSSQIWTAKGYICLLQGTALISSSQNLHKWTEAAFEPHSEQYTTCPQCCRSCSSKSTSCTLWGAPEEFHTKLVSHNSIKNAQKQYDSFLWKRYGVTELCGVHTALATRGVPGRSSLLQGQHPSISKYLKSMKHQLHLPAPRHHKHTKNILNILVKPHFNCQHRRTIAPGSEWVPRPHRTTIQHTRLPQRRRAIPRGVRCHRARLAEQTI